MNYERPAIIAVRFSYESARIRFPFVYYTQIRGVKTPELKVKTVNQYNKNIERIFKIYPKYYARYIPQL